MCTNGRRPGREIRSLDCLQYQRSSVLAQSHGLSEAAWHTSVVPSGWTPAGFVEHLGGAEYHWFHSVVAGLPDEEMPGDEERELPPTWRPSPVAFPPVRLWPTT